MSPGGSFRRSLDCYSSGAFNRAVVRRQSIEDKLSMECERLIIVANCQALLAIGIQIIKNG